MLLFVAPSVILLIMLILLHYQKHFKFRLKCSNPEATRRFSVTSPSAEANNSNRSVISPRKSSLQAMRSRPSTITQSVSDLFEDATRYQCMFTSADDQEFDFFPIAFFAYLLFLIIICIIIATKCIFDSNYYNMHHIHEFFMDSYNQHLTFNSIVNISFSNGIKPTYIMDYILIYSIMVTSLWESLFSFYRYETTAYSVKTFHHASSIHVFGKFIIYALLYIVFFVCFIHFSYWLFVIILLLHATFNIYCTLKFASILIEKYVLFLSIGDSKQNSSMNIGMLQSVYLMRKTTLTCVIIQTFSLLLFTISYNINIMYYLPVFWCVSAMTFTLNFIRNREYVYSKIYYLNKYFYRCRCKKARHKKFKNDITNLRKTSEENHRAKNFVKKSKPEIAELQKPNTLGAITITNTINIARNNTLATQKTVSFGENKTNSNENTVNDLKINVKRNSIPMKKVVRIKSNFGLSSPSVPIELARASIIKLPQTNPYVASSHSAVIDYQRQKKEKTTQKAFAILGLSNAAMSSTTYTTPLMKYGASGTATYTNSPLDVDTPIFNTPMLECADTCNDHELQLNDYKTETEYATMIVNRAKSVPTPSITIPDTPQTPLIVNLIIPEAIDEQQTNECDKNDIDIAIDINIQNEKEKEKEHNNNNNVVEIEDLDAYDNNDDFVIHFDDDNDNVEEKHYSENIENGTRSKIEINVPKIKVIEMKENVENSNDVNLKEVVRCLNVLVGHGFYAKQNVNNLKHLSRYMHYR